MYCLYIQPVTEKVLPVVPGLIVVSVPNVVAAVVPVPIVADKVVPESIEQKNRHTIFENRHLINHDGLTMESFPFITVF